MYKFKVLLNLKHFSTCPSSSFELRPLIKIWITWPCVIIKLEKGFNWMKQTYGLHALQASKWRGSALFCLSTITQAHLSLMIGCFQNHVHFNGLIERLQYLNVVKVEVVGVCFPVVKLKYKMHVQSSPGKHSWNCKHLFL